MERAWRSTHCVGSSRERPLRVSKNIGACLSVPRAALSTAVAALRSLMADGSELKDELAVLGQHMQRFFVADRRPWAEVSSEH